MLLLNTVLNILVRNASPRGPMYFKCLIFSLSGPCELLFLLGFKTNNKEKQYVVNILLLKCINQKLFSVLLLIISKPLILYFDYLPHIMFL